MRPPCIAAGAFLAAAAALEGHGQEATVTGSTTIHVERSDAWGDPDNAQATTSPLRGYAAFDVSAAWRRSRFDQWSVSLAGKANDQPSGGERGATLSAFTVRRENGECEIPYRVEAGDFNAKLSTRTSTRHDLKGLYGEIQPRDGALGLLHSIVAFAGKEESPWRDASRGSDESAGLSWVAQSRSPGEASAGLHWVRTVLAADEGAGRARRAQDAASVTASAPFALGESAWRWQAEAAGLRGDDAPRPGAPARRASDTSLYGALTGELAKANLSWTLRAERSGPDFQPVAASVQADRREAEATLTWAGLDERVVELDWLRTRDGVESGAPLDSRYFKAHLGHRVPHTRVKFDLVASEKAARRGDGSEDRRTRYLNPSLERNWDAATLKLDLVLQRDEDRATPASDRRKREALLSAGRDVAWGEWRGRIAPTLRWTTVRTAGGVDRELEAGAAVTLTRARHTLTMTLNGQSKRPPLASAPDVSTASTYVSYQYSRGPHTFTVGYQGSDRFPSPGRNAHGSTATLEWSVQLDHRPAPAAMALRGAPFAAAARELPARLPLNAAVVAAMPLGAEPQAIMALLASAGYGEGSRELDARVYERRLLPEVRGGQKLALVFGPGGLEKSALLVSVAELASPAEVGRAYDRALREMIERLGRPDRLRSLGAFTATFASDVAAGRLARFAEWDLPEGVLRVGIPRRLDGVVRIEIQHARRLGSGLEPGWGLESIR